MFIDILTSEVWFSCVFLILSRFSSLWLPFVLSWAPSWDSFRRFWGLHGALWGALGFPWRPWVATFGLNWRSLGCLGVPKAALGGHFGLTLLGLGLPRPQFWRATAACCALWGPSGALWRPWVAPWPLFWRTIAAFLGGVVVASNMHRKSQMFWQTSSAVSTKSYKATPRTGGNS